MATTLNYSPDKVGNAMIYLVDAIKDKYLQDVHLTKLLKLLYILDEISIQETAAPVTGLDYKVWEMGPVACDVYKELAHRNTEYFSFFVDATSDGEYFLINTLNKFDNSEFSEYEIELMDRVVDEHGYKTGRKLVDLLHEKDGLWDQIVKANNLNFTNRKTTELSIDFSKKLTDDFKKELYKNAVESLSF